MSISLNGDGIISGVSSITVGAGASVFSPAANTLAFGTNGSERARIDSSGRLGIGTVPKSWATAYNVLQVGSASLVGQSEQDGQTSNWSNNAYFDTNDSRWEYSFADQASQITQSDGLIVFKTASTGTANAALSWTESARFNTSGNLVFPSGQGIDFSATANGSGTTNSELFDDYEEGSFTPQWGNSSSAYSSPAPTYNTQRGDYTKVGNVVYYDIHLITTAWNGAGSTMYVYGLPFTTRSSGYQQGGGGIFCVQGVDSANAISNLTTQIAPNTTTIELYYQTASTGGNYNTFSTNDVNETGTVSIRINGFYFTDS